MSNTTREYRDWRMKHCDPEYLMRWERGLFTMDLKDSKRGNDSWDGSSGMKGKRKIKRIRTKHHRNQRKREAQRIIDEY